jgi:predicted nucleic acid-binding Zn ribbon protein
VKKSGPKKLDIAISSLVDDLGLGLKIQQSKILDDWPVIVGEQIAKVTTAERLDAGKLFVHVARSTWRNELIFLKAELIAKINAYANQEIVKDIIFR